MSLTDTETDTHSNAEAAAQDESVSSSEDLRLIEALLFAAPEPLDERSIRERLPEGVDVKAQIEELRAFYAPRGVNIVHVAGGWTIRTAPDLAPRLKLTQKVARKLSRAAIETLAIIAYHQPVTRAEIEEIRGVVISRGTLDTLMETGWIVPKGRKETPGRPVTWVTTDEFLKHFGLAALTDLPGIEELRAAGLVGPRPVATLTDNLAVVGGRLPDLPNTEDSSDSDDDSTASASEAEVVEDESAAQTARGDAEAVAEAVEEEAIVTAEVVEEAEPIAEEAEATTERAEMEEAAETEAAAEEAEEAAAMAELAEEEAEVDRAAEEAEEEAEEAGEEAAAGEAGEDDDTAAE
jgi:segregation and condensation protein B